MKMRAPAHCGGAKARGVEITIAADGSADVPDEAVSDLRSHGFIDWVDPPDRTPDDSADPPPPLVDGFDGMNRGGLFAYLKNAGVSVSPPITNEKLREMARAAKEAAHAAKVAADHEAEEAARKAAIADAQASPLASLTNPAV